MQENVQNEGAGVPINEKKGGVGDFFKRRFSAKRLAVIAVFCALAYAVSLWEIPLPLFGATFLKLDFGNVFILLISFLLGPLEGTLVCLFKEGLRCLTSSSLCAGELANFLITSTYLLLPAIAYHYRRTLKTVLISLSVSCVIATGVGLLANRFIIFPTYAFLFGGSIFGMTVEEAFSTFFLAVLLFNLIKTVSVGLATLLVYKRLSNFFKKWKI
ncbi:MAG: ECF transporter S component [Clostridia bacterium]|nr:ECF transporter S component [Clostridia bacterium]